MRGLNEKTKEKTKKQNKSYAYARMAASEN